MSGAAVSPSSTRSSPPIVVQSTPAPATPQGATPRNLSYNSPQPPSAPDSKNLVNAVKSLGRDMDAKGILKELEWQTKITKVKEQVVL